MRGSGPLEQMGERVVVVSIAVAVVRRGEPRPPSARLAVGAKKAGPPPLLHEARPPMPPRGDVMIQRRHIPQHGTGALRAHARAVAAARRRHPGAQRCLAARAFVPQFWRKLRQN
jgi:hypothetical protein